MSAMESQITSLTIAYSSVYSRRRWKKTSKLRITGLVRGIDRWPVNSPHKGPVTRKVFPFEDVIMLWELEVWSMFYLSHCTVVFDRASLYWTTLERHPTIFIKLLNCVRWEFSYIVSTDGGIASDDIRMRFTLATPFNLRILMYVKYPPWLSPHYVIMNWFHMPH